MREGRGQQIKRMIIARKSNQARERQKLEMAEAREAAQALRVAEEAERLEEKEEEAKRQRWDKEVTQAIQARWHRVGRLDGEARAWQAQVIRKAKARRQAIRAWDKILTTVETESRRARLTGAGRDAQHRQGQLRKQQEPKQVRARQQQRQEEDHAKRRLASVAEASTEEGGWALALEEEEKTADKKEARRLHKHKAKCDGNITLWKKTEKDAARKTAKQMQARIRQLATETAATFDFDIGQSAEIADSKSRYRLNRVFSTGKLESPEETVKRYWRRAAEQPHVEGFIANKTKGIEEAVSRLRTNVRYRMERQPETIETSWQELRAVVQDQIQSLVAIIEADDKMGVKEALCDVMYTMCAARDEEEGASEGVSALSMRDEIMFHAVKVGVTFDGMQKEEETVADTGAAPLLVSENRLSVEVLQRSLVPGRARVMHSASSHRLKARGGARLDFKLSGCDLTFNHEWQVTEGATTPTLLGVSFWAKYKAQFDFRDRVIRMVVNGASVMIPFTIGDEKP